jgi:hypothetical protein
MNGDMRRTSTSLTMLMTAALLLAADVPKAAPEFRPYKRPVTIWVPPYAVGKCKQQLESNPAMADALTHLALQFWVPTRTGGVEWARKDEASENVVAELRDWGHARGVRVMLCVYNAGGGKWDWTLARAAFADNCDAFVKSLIAEVERHNLDGVDMDLEGNGDFGADKAAFVAFMARLSKELHARGKHLTIDTFAARWHAPNQTWWPELLPLVDALVTMGYDEIGATAPEWRAYAAQRDAAGEHAGKLQIGMPSGKDAWRGNTALEQLMWVRDDGKTGIAIWDAQLRAAAWRTPEVWKIVKDIRERD